MNQNTYLFVLITIVSSNFIVGAHIFKDYKNKEVVLTSVYDSMKNNLQANSAPINLMQDDLLPDSRNKRNTNINDKIGYYDSPSGQAPPPTDWAVVNAPLTNDLVCTRNAPPEMPQNRVSDPNSAGVTVAILAKYGLVLLGALLLPVIIFKVFILPAKILLGLKMMSLLNSFLLGAMLLKYKFSQHRPHYYGGSGYGGPGFGGGGGGGGQPGYPIAGTVPGSTSSSSGATSSAAGNSFELSDENDLVDVVRPGEDFKRIMSYVKKRNKSW